MKKNMGNNDRVLRLVLAALFVVLFFQGVVDSVLGIILLVLAGVFVVTSVTGICPLYSLFRKNTGGKNSL